MAMPTSKYTGKYPVVKKYLEKGDKGENIIRLQNYLNWYTCGGFFAMYGKADGVYGNNTLKWVKKMQADFFGVNEADGLVGPKTIAKMKEFSDSIDEKQAYVGGLPSLRVVKTNAQVKADTVKWAKWIAGDNRFHYGKGEHSHHNGCYFCGTQPKSKKTSGIVDYQFTYCCNPFVHAAWAHGGLVPKALSMCQVGKSWDFNKGQGYDASSLFSKLGHPAKSSLQAGDVLCSGSHIALYVGNGKLAEAGSQDDNKKNSSSWNNSIRVKILTDSNYSNFSRVYRYNGSVNADILMKYGEVGNRVAQWQTFLNWYYNGQLGEADGIFGDNTLKWTKRFQEEVIGPGEGDGIVGSKTLVAAASVKK